MEISSNDVLEYIDVSNKCKTIDSAFQSLENVLSKLGVDRIVYSLMTDHHTIGKKAGHGILKNYPDDWMGYYTDKQYEDVDPVRKYIMQTHGAFRWSDIDKLMGGLKKDEKLLMNEANEAKLLDGVGFSLHAINNETLGMGFASSVGGINLCDNTMSIISMIATQFHSVFMKLNNQNKEVIFFSITDREKEVLKWCAMGKTYWEISTILNISEATVRFHINNTCKKFKVSTKITAVIKAITYGIIKI